MRRGRRIATPHALVYLADTGSDSPVRFGFIVAKTVGIAVQRNLVRRRLKAVSYQLLPLLACGTEIVIRALPGSAQASWDILQSEISDALAGGRRRA